LIRCKTAPSHAVSYEEFLRSCKLVLWLHIQMALIYRIPVETILQSFVEMLRIVLQCYGKFLPKTALPVTPSLTGNLLFEVCSSVVAVLISKKLRHKKFLFCKTFLSNFSTTKPSVLHWNVHLRKWTICVTVESLCVGAHFYSPNSKKFP
jgi:hypothetical protein